MPRLSFAEKVLQPLKAASPSIIILITIIIIMIIVIVIVMIIALRRMFDPAKLAAAPP